VSSLPTPSTASPRRRRRLALAVTGVILLIAGLLAAYWRVRPRPVSGRLSSHQDGRRGDSAGLNGGGDVIVLVSLLRAPEQ
jgi:hypothetical protein